MATFVCSVGIWSNNLGQSKWVSASASEDGPAQVAYGLPFNGKLKQILSDAARKESATGKSVSVRFPSEYHQHGELLLAALLALHGACQFDLNYRSKGNVLVLSAMDEDGRIVGVKDFKHRFQDAQKQPIRPKMLISQEDSLLLPKECKIPVAVISSIDDAIKVYFEKN